MCIASIPGLVTRSATTFHAHSKIMWRSSKESKHDTRDVDDIVWPHPGAVGTMMIPPGAVKGGSFRRRQRGKSNRREHADAATDEPALDTAAVASDFSDHPLCSKPKVIDELLLEVKTSADKELRAEAEARELQERTDQLDGELKRLQRNRRKLIEAHQAELAHVQKTLEENAREDKRLLVEELTRNHAELMDELVREVAAGQETVTSGGSQEDQLRLRRALARLLGNERARTGQRRARDPTPLLAWDTRPTTAVVDTLGGGSNGGNAIEAAEELTVPQSVGFWRGVHVMIKSHDLGSNGLTRSKVYHGVEATVGGRETEGLMHPAVLVLAAVPIFCLWRRWRLRRE